ncbi:MAG TPA: LysM peptidoglycan-binding domain-containing protein [Cryptosporangiaceae bacterium]|nr:LysM peptidoglycan-binding domain-containing protein [Cryptosporangiaceae bacterium]
MRAGQIAAVQGAVPPAGGPALRVVRVRAVVVPERRRESAPVRLTRRGRIVARVVLLLAAVLLVLAAAGVTRADETSAAPPSVVVREGDTLWSIADRWAPDRPTRETIAEIRRLNGLDGSTVRVGERVVLPRR